jgi:proteic killer suppression protein
MGYGIRMRKKKMSDFYSIRINDQWRIIFRWDDGNSSDVTIMDYHK